MTSIRDARPADGAPLLAILNAEIRDDVNVWHETERGAEIYADWLASPFPALVAERAGSVVGFSRYGPFRPHSGYAHTVEHSVFVAPEARGLGVGRALLAELIARAEAAGGIHAMIGGIESTNTASIRLHASLGFEEVGRLPEVGRKFDRWLTLVFMQRMIG